MPYKIIIMLFLMIISHKQVNAQALHWLSQPNGQLGAELNGDVNFAKTSANGRFIAFVSAASNIVAGDNNQISDLFVYDSLNNTTRRATKTATGEIPADHFTILEFSKPTSDGQWVAFTALVGPPGGGPSTRPMYLKNLNTGALEVASFDSVAGAFDVYSSVHLADDAGSLTFTTSENLDPLHTGLKQNLYRKNLSTNQYTLLSKSFDNTAGVNNHIDSFSVSANNRYIAFASRATNLTADTVVGNNGYLYDNVSGTLQVFTVKPNGQVTTDVQSRGPSSISVSNQGQVAHVSRQTDLVSNDNNGQSDLFLFNGSQNIRLNLNENGKEITDPNVNSVIISADGTRVIFSDTSALLPGDTNGIQDVYTYEVRSAQISRLITTPVNTSSILTPNNQSQDLSANGQKLLLRSSADLTNSPNYSYRATLFEYDFTNQQIQHLNPVVFNPNTITTNVYQPKISADQQSVIYSSATRNLTTQVDNDSNLDLFLLDRNSDQHLKIGKNLSQIIYSISPSGEFITFTSNFFQPNGTVDLGEQHVFLYNRNNQQYTQIATGSNPSVNDAGMVVFSSSNNLTANDNNNSFDVYLFDPSDNSLSLVSTNPTGIAGNGDSFNAKISGSSSDQWIVFVSGASDLVAADTNSSYDIFMRSWPGGSVFRVSQRPTLEEANNFSISPAISYDGSVVSFTTLASNLTNDDYTNSVGKAQVLAYDRDTQWLELVSQDSNGDPISSFASYNNSTSTSGRYIAYTTASAVLAEDNDNYDDIYLYDRDLSTTVLISKNTSNQQSDNVFSNSDVVEDLLSTPPLLGLAFNGGGDLTGVDAHPNHTEAFLYQQGGPNVELNITVTGMGIVNGSLGISCFSNCSFHYPLGTELNLIASPDSGFLFNKWQSSRGQCTDNSNPCQLTMNRDKNIYAIFIDENDLIFKDGFE